MNKKNDSCHVLFSNPLFPVGLRVLVVDDDATCLRVLEGLLQACHYKVMKCERAKDALRILQEGKDEVDIVISEVRMSGMDGFQLLDEIIGLEIDLPVVMMSIDDKVDVVKKVVVQGACGYLLKPVRKEEIKLIWQHVVRRKLRKGFSDSGEMPRQQNDPNNKQDHHAVLAAAHHRHVNTENCGSSNTNDNNILEKNLDKEAKAKPNDNRDDHDTGTTPSVKKPRMVWTPQLHQQFVAVVNQIGLKNAVPKKILDLMNIPHLTRENVASHLQKYRIHLQRNGDQNSQKKLSIHHLHSTALHDDINIEAAYAVVLNQQPVLSSQCSMNAVVDLLKESPDLRTMAGVVPFVPHQGGDYNYIYNYGRVTESQGGDGRSTTIIRPAPAQAVRNILDTVPCTTIDTVKNVQANNLCGGLDFFPHQHHHLHLLPQPTSFISNNNHNNSGCTASSASSMVHHFEQEDHDPLNNKPASYSK